MNAPTPDAEVNRVARLLMAEWERVDEPVSPSRVANFADMARVVIADRLAQAQAPTDADAVTCSGRCDSRQSDNPDAPDFPDPQCPRHGEAQQLWVVDELDVALPGPPPEGEEHPERTPVGPFTSRQAAGDWAADQVAKYGGSGSWGCAPLRSPEQP